MQSTIPFITVHKSACVYGMAYHPIEGSTVESLGILGVLRVLGGVWQKLNFTRKMHSLGSQNRIRIIKNQKPETRAGLTMLTSHHLKCTENTLVSANAKIPNQKYYKHTAHSAHSEKQKLNIATVDVRNSSLQSSSDSCLSIEKDIGLSNRARTERKT